MDVLYFDSKSVTYIEQIHVILSSNTSILILGFKTKDFDKRFSETMFLVTYTYSRNDWVKHLSLKCQSLLHDTKRTEKWFKGYLT